MGRKAVLVALALGAALLLGGCASMGKPFNYDAVDSLVPGQTTEQDALAALGESTGRTVQGDGQVLVQWLSSETAPFYLSSQSVMILFDASGRMVRVVRRSSL